MHVKSQRVFSAFDQIASYIDTCDSFCLEIDLEISKDHDIQGRMMLPMDKPLSSLLKRKEFNRLGIILSDLNGPAIDNLNYLRPMNVIGLLSSLIMEEDKSMNLDASLYQYAAQKGVRTFGIETKEEHIDILDAMQLDLELKQLRSIIRNFRPFKKNHHKLMNHYLNGRIDKLYQSGKKSLGVWRMILLKNRNLKIADRMILAAQSESVFCAIGAAHLAGKFGVLRLLKLQGATLKPVSLQFV